MTGHDRFLELAASAIDFELTPDESGALQRHLEGCDACRRRIAAIRTDARSIAALPMLPAAGMTSVTALARLDRRASRAWLQIIAVAALVLAVVAGAIVVGAELVRRLERVPPTVIAPSPTPAASAGASLAPSLSPAPTLGADAGRWHVESLDVGELPFGISAVAASGSRLVTVGGRTCVPVDAEPTDCWANSFTSDDGGATWVAAPRSDALAVGTGCCIGSGPETGLLDVAAGRGAFVGIGYDGQYRAAAWTSVDGIAWTKSPPDVTWDLARVRSVAATSTGWVVGGEAFLDAGPRAAIWESPDGATWTRAQDGPAFDIGGYLDTGEEPGSGGIADVTALGSIGFAVGSACDPVGRGCVTSAWTSSGGSWTRSNKPGAFTGKLRAVAPFGQELVAAGLRCGISDTCPAEARTGAVMTSADRQTWTELEIPGTTGSGGVRAIAAAADYLVGVVEGIEGVDGIDARPTGELILVGSVDGDTWTLLEGVPQLGLTDIRDVGLTPTADGAILIVGWGAVPAPEGFRSFVVRVTRAPG